MRKYIMYHCSPFIVAAVLCLIPIVFGIITITSRHGVSLLLFLPALLVFLYIDHVIKSWTKGNVNYVWAIEALTVCAILVTWRFAL
ncbi:MULTISPECIES: hypothetical protein [Niastella]|uniref:Uncharacterized protein n=1 Tax=Niastella soli TaxID=2821487 RepID=A0ABS3Z1G3_9BACT|nr:hypothetical protein [Niastella soli]MBO9204006.1 hypothetical protein [Niastella soli]